MKTLWPAFVLTAHFLAACTQFLGYRHCRIQVVQLVEGGEVVSDMLVMSLPLIMHLCLHWRRRLNVSI